MYLGFPITNKISISQICDYFQTFFFFFYHFQARNSHWQISLCSVFLQCVQTCGLNSRDTTDYNIYNIIKSFHNIWMEMIPLSPKINLFWSYIPMFFPIVFKKQVFLNLGGQRLQFSAAVHVWRYIINKTTSSMMKKLIAGKKKSTFSLLLKTHLN